MIAEAHMKGQRMGISWRVMAALLATVLLASCSPKKREISKNLETQIKSLQATAGDAVAAATQRQAVPPGSEVKATSSVVRYLEPEAPLWVQSGKSQVVRLSYPAKRISVGNPDVAGVVVLGPDTFIINGKTVPEQKTEDQRLAESGVRIQRGTFLGRTITRPPQIAESTLIVWSEQGISVHPLIVADFMDSQVMLEVTVAEVNRSALEEHGIDFRVAQNDLIAAGWLGAGAPPGQQITVPPFTAPLFPLVGGANGPTYGLIFPDENISALIQALETEGLATVLARPTMTAMSGQAALFQVGGEIPIRIVTDFTVSVEYKPFGTLVNFVPQVMDDGDIFLTVTPEVSEADFSQLVDDVPTFRTRRASTTARLRNGETLVMSGLLLSRTAELESGVPYLKDIPVLGYAFRGTRYTRDTVELMIVVKPTIVNPIPPGMEVPLPRGRAPLTRAEAKTTWRAEAEVTRPRLLPPEKADTTQSDEVRSKSVPSEATDPRLPGMP